MPLRLGKKELIDLIDQIEAGGGDASQLRQELEILEAESAPAQNHYNHRTSPRGRAIDLDGAEETIADRLSRRVGDLFSGGVTEALVADLVELDRNHSLKELKCICVENGLSPSGDKKELCAKLVAKGIFKTKMPQTTVPA